ncbi:hypothetical protein [Methylobacterium sp. NEAU K]|uniref:hypothetical protein n=1 Tax=Methylobacterium sp. NEAU K TaxID=3064946 RepID=UPI00273530B1|nr:hypothetical protein [Methylobacterium sp. NEAU K]MDP4002668.1 hypothetical protein [Methylobacterium sp. NEAU K]
MKSLLSMSLLAASLSVPSVAQAQPDARAPALLFHGNYCGPGNNAPLRPIDALDAACARHDACVPGNGLPSRVCNLRLQQEADYISRDPRQPSDLRAMAGFVAAGAAMLPFDPNSLAVAEAVPIPARHWEKVRHHRSHRRDIVQAE